MLRRLGMVGALFALGCGTPSGGHRPGDAGPATLADRQRWGAEQAASGNPCFDTNGDRLPCEGPELPPIDLRGQSREPTEPESPEVRELRLMRAQMYAQMKYQQRLAMWQQCVAAVRQQQAIRYGIPEAFGVYPSFWGAVVQGMERGMEEGVLCGPAPQP